jgi:hypothetical protein
MTTIKLRKRRKPRFGEKTCTCSAYRFPHRFGGGECDGSAVAEDYWDAHWGDGLCAQCNCCRGSFCDVVAGAEDAKYGRCYQELVEFHEIKIYDKVTIRSNGSLL